MNRREFLKGSAIASVWTLGGCAGFPAITSVKSPNSLLRHAAFGTANMAGCDIREFATHPGVEMAAFCDVDSAYLAAIGQKFPKARLYRDWRELFEKEGDSIDSVNVSVPDHNHVPMALEAMRCGKHLYLQKPLCKTLEESAQLRRAAATSGVVTQMGNQLFANDADRETVAILRSGLLGPVERAVLFSSRGGKSRKPRYLPASAPVPKTLDWKLWLGDAAFRPYAPEVYHPLLWRVWRDLGSGWIGDLGAHVFSSLWLGMDLGRTASTKVRAESQTDCTPGLESKVWPTSSHIVWDFPGVPASDGRPFAVEWFDGIDQPGEKLAPEKFRVPAEIDALFAKTPDKKRPFEGKAIRCKEGWILQPHSGDSHAWVVRDDGRPFAAPRLAPVPSHWHEFLDRAIGGGRAASDFAWTTWMTDELIRGGQAICS